MHLLTSYITICSFTCHQSIERNSICLLCSAYYCLYNKQGNHFLHFSCICCKFIAATIGYNLEVYAGYTYSLTISQADVINEGKRAAAFSWITGLFSASLVVGNLLARFLPEEYIFQVCFTCDLFSMY